MTAIELHPAARNELEAAAAWYEERRPALGAKFLARIADVMRWISASPNGGTEWPGVDVRTWRVARFPYLVVYAHEPDRVVVLAIAHTKRRPGYWVERAR